MPEEIITTIATIEKEAQNVLEEARVSARQILANAKEEATRLLSSELPLAEIKIEHDRIICAAEEEANRQIEESLRRVRSHDFSGNKRHLCS
jgi:F0F1-type ATP synthase membrane subunit b/b'